MGKQKRISGEEGLLLAAYGKRQERDDVDWREWAMFAKCPEAELPWCWLYEFARESFLLCGMTRKKFLASSLRQKTDFALEALIRLCPEFPEKCWLAIDEGFRRQRIESVRWPIRVRGGNRRVEWCNGVVQPYSGMLSGAWVLRGEDGEFRDDVARMENGRRVSYHVLRLDWSLSKEYLVQSFRQLVEDLRTADFAGDGFEAVEERKRGSERSDLKALAAKRLLKRMAADDAERHVRDVLHTEKDLFHDQQGWIRAAERAAGIVQMVRPVGLGEPSGFTKAASVFKEGRKRKP